MSINIIKIIGGLGNQMFQYAFYYSFVRKNNDGKSKLDITEFGQYTLHNGIELNSVFGINLKDQIATLSEIKKVKDKHPFFKYRKILGRILSKNPNLFLSKKHFVEKSFSNFSPEVYNFKGKYLEGYWQNEKYFKFFRSELLAFFSWKNVTEQNQKYAERMKNENSVSVHIRRFDKPKTFHDLFYRLRLALVWRTCKKSYYLRSIDLLNKELINPVFYIFTDNINWVKKNIPQNKNFILVDWNRGKDSNQDMYLMTRCKHNIISMSSFSWWGAWLNQNPEKIVIAPKKWAAKFVRKTDIIPQDWIKL